MRHPITDIFFTRKPNGDYWVRVDFPHPHDASLRHGTIGEIYSLGANTNNKRWVATLADGIDLGTFPTRNEAADALLRNAEIITVNGRTRYLFNNTGLEEVT